LEKKGINRGKKKGTAKNRANDLGNNQIGYIYKRQIDKNIDRVISIVNSVTTINKNCLYYL
jgi:hypothetical protein